MRQELGWKPYPNWDTPSTWREADLFHPSETTLRRYTRIAGAAPPGSIFGTGQDLILSPKHTRVNGNPPQTHNLRKKHERANTCFWESFQNRGATTAIKMESGASWKVAKYNKQRSGAFQSKRLLSVKKQSTYKQASKETTKKQARNQAKSQTARPNDPPSYVERPLRSRQGGWQQLGQTRGRHP